MKNRLFRHFHWALCIGLLLSPIVGYGAKDFSVAGEPVNPACLAMINKGEADQPFIYGLNMDLCQNANAAAVGAGKGTAFKHKGDVYIYRVLGKTRNQIFVVLTQQSAGGSGIFQEVLLLRLGKKTIYVNSDKDNALHEKPYTALIYLGSLAGGDRYTGSYHDLRVDGHRLKGWRFSSKNPPYKKQYPDEAIDIDLSGL